MPTEGHIFIQGEILPWQDEDIGEWGGVNVKNVSKKILDNASAEKLIVHIHSPGGDVDEAFAIHDILVNADKQIETRIEGLCASAATIIALAGSVRLITENSTFMIHNPWMWPYPGDADELQKQADMMKEIENKIINFYSQKTGSTPEQLDQWMKEETWMTADQALELGFVTDIMTGIKAVAKIRTNKNNEMNTQELEQKIDGKLNSFLNKIKSYFSVKMVTVTTGDGVVLDFGDQAQTVDEIAIGMKATVDGSPASGEYTMPDSAVWVFDDTGTLTEMRDAPDQSMEQLQAKVDELENKVAELSAQNAAKDAAMNKVQSEFVTFKREIKSDISSLDPDGERQELGDGGGAQSRIPKRKIEAV